MIKCKYIYIKKNILNEDDLIPILKTHNFNTVHLEDYN